MNKIIFILVLSLTCTEVMAITFDECTASSSKMNAKLPIMADKYTMLENTTCFKDVDNNLVFRFMFKLLAKADTSQKYISKQTTLVRNKLCSMNRKQLKKIDYEYSYFDTEGNNLFNVRVSDKDCK